MVDRKDISIIMRGLIKEGYDKIKQDHLRIRGRSCGIREDVGCARLFVRDNRAHFFYLTRIFVPC